MIAYVSIPALVALIFKLVLLVYAARSPAKNTVTRLFLALLVVLTLLNLIEFSLLNYFSKHGLTPIVHAGGYGYIGLWSLAIPILLHLSLALSFEDAAPRNQRWLILALYGPVLPLEYLLLFTDKFVLEFKPFLYSILREPGPWYWMGESWAIACLSATFAILVYGARGSRPALSRMRNRLWLLALTPMIVLAVYLLIANRYGWTQLTFPVYAPITMTFFLLVTTYATHERPRPGGFYRFLYSLFDIESFLPWSKAHLRKTTLYRRIEKMIAELGGAHSINDIVGRLSDTFQCPVVWVGGLRPVAARASRVPEITVFPKAELPKIDRVLLAHQTAQALPATNTLMKRHRVAAIVPFHPHSKTAASWLLLGESFMEQIYTPQDLETAKTLFDRLADYFVDQQMLMQAQLSEARQETRALYRRLTHAWDRFETGRERLQVNKAKNRRLQRPSAARLSDAFERIQSELLERGVAGRKTLVKYTAAFEARIIAKALEHCNGNQAKAAALLGVRPNTLYYKIRRYGLTNSVGERSTGARAVRHHPGSS